MDKFISKETTKNEVSIILPTEKIFSIKLLEELGKDFKIIKSKEKYCSIDFLIINKLNIKCIYLEYKKRVGQSRKYKSIIVNHSKIISIKRNYNKCIFVFEYDNDTDFIEYDETLFKSFNGAFVKNQDTIKIENQYLNNGFENLSNFIKKTLK